MRWFFSQVGLVSGNGTSFSHQTPTLDSLFDLPFKANLWIFSIKGI
jgi:hypothetical protein